MVPVRPRRSRVRPRQSRRVHRLSTQPFFEPPRGCVKRVRTLSDLLEFARQSQTTILKLQREAVDLQEHEGRVVRGTLVAVKIGLGLRNPDGQKRGLTNQVSV